MQSIVYGNMVDSSQLMGLTNMELAGTIREKYNATAGEIIKRWERINCTYHTVDTQL